MIMGKEYKVRNDKVKGQTKTLLTHMLRKHPQERPLIEEVVERLEDILEAFEFAEKKKRTNSTAPSAKREEVSP